MNRSVLIFLIIFLIIVLFAYFLPEIETRVEHTEKTEIWKNLSEEEEILNIVIKEIEKEQESLIFKPINK